MKKGCIRLWLVGLVGSVLGVGAEASSRAQVLGQVRLEGGLSVVGAQVLLFDLADLRQGVVAEATTDAAGAFALAWGGLRPAQTPVGFVLGHNFPNPFNPATVIPYHLAAASQVRLEVFNLLGQRVATLVDGAQAAGAQTAVWNATDAAGQAVSAGVYVYRLTVDGVSQTGRMVLVDGGAGFNGTSAGSVEATLARAELVEARPEGANSAYGLVVLGPGLVPYMDVAVRLGAGPLAIELAAVGPGRGKVMQTEGQRLLGDVDRDGRITYFDAMLVMLYALNPSVPLPVEGAILLGDVDADERVTVIDAWLIATYLVAPSDPMLPDGIGQPLDPLEPGRTVGEKRSFPLPGPGEMRMEFVWIEPGTFRMGSLPTEEGRNDDEGPVYGVTISKGFWLGKYEVTQGEWESVMGSNPSYYEGNARRPVEKVSWEDVQQFIAKLNEAEGSAVYRLPTEAEWEYACRAGSTTRWSFGDDEEKLGKYAWYGGNNSGTKVVGWKKPNAWGLYDMHGNVYEWVQHWYDGNYYNVLNNSPSSSRIDPQGPDTGSHRVIRGGFFLNDAQSLRSAVRYHDLPAVRGDWLGVRLLRISTP